MLLLPPLGALPSCHLFPCLCLDAHLVLLLRVHLLTLGRNANSNGAKDARFTFTWLPRAWRLFDGGLDAQQFTLRCNEPYIAADHDNDQLIETLKHLRDLGNTVIVVEHDEDTIKEADHIVDIGPKAGRLGGEIVYNGSLTGLLKNKSSL